MPSVPTFGAGGTRGPFGPTQSEQESRAMADTSARHIALKLAAPNDVNGNPRRGWIILDADGNAVAFIDEGYDGYRAVRKAYPHAVESAQVNVAAREYASWIKYNDTECAR